MFPNQGILEGLGISYILIPAYPNQSGVGIIVLQSIYYKGALNPPKGALNPLKES